MTANNLSIFFSAGLAAVTLLLTINSLNTKAQQSKQLDDSNAVARLIRYEVKPELEVEFRKAISEYVFFALKDENNILTEAYYEQDKPHVLWIIERWSSRAAIQTISKIAQFKAIVALSESGLNQPEKTFYVKDLEPLSKVQWNKKSNKEDDPITIMLFVDSKKGTEGSFKELYHAAMPKFRSEPGVINYQLSQLENDSTRFVTYEKFRNEDAFKYHLSFPAINPVIDYLNTSIEKQPFQAGLHKLIAFAPATHE